MATINHWWQQIRLIVAVLMLLAVAGFVGAQWQQRTDANERMQLVNRFPKVRADAAASATEAANAKSAVEISGLKSENQALRDSQELLAKSVADTHEIAAYTLRFLGDRAQKTDARQAALMKQSRETTQKLDVVVQKTAVVEQTAKVAAAQSAEAASTVKEVRKDLRTATQPPLPAKPWVGGRN